MSRHLRSGYLLLLIPGLLAAAPPSAAARAELPPAAVEALQEAEDLMEQEKHNAAHGGAESTIATAMAYNGTDFGIRVSGLGERWFTAPATVPQGLYFSGFSGTDANPDIGDSTITETVGLGAFAMAAAPAIVTFIGGTPQDALHATLEMYEITAAENPQLTIPARLGRRGPGVFAAVRPQVERFHQAFQGERGRVQSGVDEVARAARELLNSLVTNAPPRDRAVEAAKARARSADRFHAGDVTRAT